MPSQEVLYDVSGRVATVTLHRPERLNAWTRVMEEDVRAAMTRAAADEDVRVIVLTGAGRGFCAGADMSLLNDVANRGADGLGLRNDPTGGVENGRDGGARPDFQRKYSYFPAIPKPVIAALNGPAVGLGLVIALYCDLRFAAEGAKFGTAFARRGLIAEYGIAWLLP